MSSSGLWGPLLPVFSFSLLWENGIYDSGALCTETGIIRAVAPTRGAGSCSCARCESAGRDSGALATSGDTGKLFAA